MRSCGTEKGNGLNIYLQPKDQNRDRASFRNLGLKQRHYDGWQAEYLVGVFHGVALVWSCVVFFPRCCAILLHFSHWTVRYYLPRTQNKERRVSNMASLTVQKTRGKTHLGPRFPYPASFSLSPNRINRGMNGEKRATNSDTSGPFLLPLQHAGTLQKAM